MNVMSFTKLAAVTAVTVCLTGGLGACSSVVPKTPGSSKLHASIVVANSGFGSNGQRCPARGWFGLRIVPFAAVVAFAKSGPTPPAMTRTIQRCSSLGHLQRRPRCHRDLSHQSLTKRLPRPRPRLPLVRIGVGVGDDAYFSWISNLHSSAVVRKRSASGRVRLAAFRQPRLS